MSDAAVDLSGRVIQLEHEIQRLSDEVAVLRTLIDPEDIRALEKMRRNPVTNEQLRIWAQKSVIPEGLDDKPEGKPW